MRVVELVVTDDVTSEDGYVGGEGGEREVCGGCVDMVILEEMKAVVWNGAHALRLIIKDTSTSLTHPTYKTVRMRRRDGCSHPQMLLLLLLLPLECACHVELQ